MKTAAEAFELFIQSIDDYKKSESKRSYKKPLNVKSIREILKFKK